MLGLVSVTMAMGCGPDAVGSDTSNSGSGSSVSSGSSDESGVLATWPEESYGGYYLDPGISLGIPGMYIGGLFNLDLRRDGLSLNLMDCNGDPSDDLLEQFTVDYEGEEAHVRPREGDSQVILAGSPVAAELIFRPGATCNTLDTEVVDPDPTWNFEPTLTWHRGALVITDTCSATDDVWAVDLDPDVPTDCGAG